MTTRDKIIELLIRRAPNWVNKEVIRERLSERDEPAISAAISDMIQSQRIVEETDQLPGVGNVVRYYRLSSYEGIPIRDSIEVGSIKVPRLLARSKITLFPEDFNEAIERLAEYATGLERRFAELVKEEQRTYWATIVSVFGVFVAVLALVLTGLPKITTDSSLPFWKIVELNGAQLLPMALVLALFVLVLRRVIR